MGVSGVAEGVAWVSQVSQKVSHARNIHIILIINKKIKN
ncbi:hypothetical protein ArsFIN_56200 (plasmid) [Arsenophonus nasoniae]|uniref:Uncharacterized protein n=1 Tax=Arsenophonus nasoniae TaxID=638 RepID=A0A4P7L2K7_9GAMM|nr:hypothetical protein ArsFIN_56200 [Arsenophonus nasoniae]